MIEDQKLLAVTSTSIKGDTNLKASHMGGAVTFETLEDDRSLHLKI